MRHILVRYYRARDFDLRQDGESFSGLTNCLVLNGLDLNYGALSADVSAPFPGSDFVRQQIVLSGRCLITMGHSRFHGGVNDAPIMPANAR